MAMLIVNSLLKKNVSKLMKRKKINPKDLYS